MRRFTKRNEWDGKERETEHILKLCALFAECSLCEAWWIRKELEAAVLCLSKNKILHRSSKHNAIPPPFHWISALTWKAKSLMCWKPFRFHCRKGLTAFLSCARNKIDVQKLIKIQFSKSLSTRVTPFTLQTRHSLIQITKLVWIRKKKFPNWGKSCGRSFPVTLCSNIPKINLSQFYPLPSFLNIYKNW